MYCFKKISNDAYWVGVNDRKISLFESVYPVSRGVSYNSYLVLDEKTVLLDTVDSVASLQFLENVEKALGGRNLDYLIVNHMEPDHCANIGSIVAKYPSVKIVGNAKTFAMMGQFFDFDIESRKVVVKEGDTLNTGKHTFTFVTAPMVHWPEAMVTYDSLDKTLYSADAFGSFGAMSGNIFADECNFEEEWLDDARRYYTNIVGKYGVQVQALLKKASSLEIARICPLHGPIWRKDIAFIVDKYQKWSSYTPEKKGVLIVYGSVHGNTENAAEVLANMLDEKGVKGITMVNAATAHFSEIIAKCFKYSHIVFACATYNASIFPSMHTVLHELSEHNLQNRTFAFIENGTWAPLANKLMQEILDKLKNNEILESKVSVKSSLDAQSLAAMEALAEEIVKKLDIK
ncbi:MAG: FprA family A-type flavoprotein [Clostridia bacterium]|nr:FprA family A-type flavoprotein [Clostridia bacterium]MDE7329358.1 FprA family A-type flavoprotein [Clostridia bacterium]